MLTSDKRNGLPTQPRSCVFPLDDSLNDAKTYAAGLQQFCNDVAPQVAALVDAQLTHENFRRWNMEKDGDHILRSAGICGVAAEHMANILTARGDRVQYAKIPDLQRFGNYPYEDHYFLVVGDATRETIVDPAFYQCIRLLGLKKEQMPSQDVLVFPYADLKLTVGRLAALRLFNPNPELTVWVRDFFSEKYPVQVSMDYKALVQYFTAIWDYNNFGHIVSDQPFGRPKDPNAQIPPRSL